MNYLNHPKRGERIVVDPIKDIKNIKAIANITKSKPRDHLLFLMGVNNGLRVCDILRLKVKDIRNLGVGDTFVLKESKTGKENILVINKTVYKALKHYFDEIKPDDSDYLFLSRKGRKPLQSQAVSKMVKVWAEAINLKGRFGAHTLRKTWGYIQRKNHGVGFEIICKRFNHSNPAITMRYLGIEDKEVHETLMNEIG